ncbi:MAG: protease modulator HflC [Myxococcales bacterium]|nr:protease modulator HflC [Myxococcales bacterium]MCB9550270.1 protease modulator HflC [Myxococcales bacterium]
MSPARQITLFIVAVLAIWFATQSFFVVDETEQAVITEFGKPIATETEAGIKFKLPWQTTHFFEKRLVRWDGQKSEIPTKDKKFIEVDSTARWRIVEPRKFLESVGDVRGAQARLDDIIDSAVRQAVTENILIEIVRSDKAGKIVERLQAESSHTEDDAMAPDENESEDDLLYRIQSGREEMQQTITDRSKAIIRDEYGIELLDVRIKRLNYIEDVRQTIYGRMISERNKIAEKYRSQGRGLSARIAGEMERKLRIIRSTAERRAQEIEGEGDAVAARIYARAFNVDGEFYSFYQTLASYRTSIKPGLRPVFSLDGEYFRYLQDRGGPGIQGPERDRRLQEVQSILKDLEALGKAHGEAPAGGEAPLPPPPVEVAPPPALPAPAPPALPAPVEPDQPAGGP